MRRIARLVFKKGSSHTTVQAYQPTEQEIRLQKQAADYSEAVAPNALWLNNVAQGLLKDSLGTIQVDYNKLMQNANQQIGAAQQGVADLTQGKLPAEYQKNMEASIQHGVENTMGKALNGLGQRGILNSSVTNTAMNDISKNVANTMAEQYQSNIGTLNGLYGQQAALAGQQITNSAAAQEAAQQPALNLWNASLGLNTGGTLGALNAVGGKGTTTTTQKTSGGGGLFGGIMTGLMGNPGLFGACFTGDTVVAMADGTEKCIKNIKAGESVLSYDVKENRNVHAVVEETMQPKENEVIAVRCGDDEDNSRFVFTTSTQPLLKEDDEYIDVQVLKIGTELKNVGRVVNMFRVDKRKVYDLKLSNGDNYYANGFIAKSATDEW